jgi:tartrate dehydratase beta subunit/fumarate hydratase class I family protein
MSEIRAELLGRHPIKTRLSLTGPLVVARDIAHAKIKERLDAGEGMPQYLKDHWSTTQVRPRRRRHGVRLASDPRRRDAWTATSTRSRRRAAAS